MDDGAPISEEGGEGHKRVPIMRKVVDGPNIRGSGTKQDHAHRSIVDAPPRPEHIPPQSEHIPPDESPVVVGTTPPPPRMVSPSSSPPRVRRRHIQQDKAGQRQWRQHRHQQQRSDMGRRNVLAAAPWGHRQHREENDSVCLNVLWMCIQVCAALMVVMVVVLIVTSPTVLKWVYQQQQSHWGNGGGGLGRPKHLIAIWDQPHRTNASVVTRNNTHLAALWRIRQSLRYHLLNAHGTLHCLCMHHLDRNAFTNALLLPKGSRRTRANVHGSDLPYRRVCAIYNGIYDDGPGRNTTTTVANAEQIYFMVNPRPRGSQEDTRARSEDMLQFVETSISCPQGTPPRQRARPRNLFIEWENERGTTLYALFRDATAACLQLSLEEFAGDAHCYRKEDKGQNKQ